MHEFAKAFRPLTPVSGRTTAALALLWAALALGWWITYPPPVVPRPLDVFAALQGLIVDGGLVNNLLSSLVLNVEAIAISLAVSLALAYLTVLAGFQPVVRALSKLRFLGLTGLTFAFGLVWSGHALKVSILVFGLTVFFITSLADVVASIPQSQYDYARSLRAGPWEVTWNVVVRGTFDQALDVLRQNAAMGWMMLTMVEGLVRMEGGVGVLLLNENRHFRLESVFAVQLVILAVGLLQDFFLGWVKATMCPYAVTGQGRRAS